MWAMTPRAGYLVPEFPTQTHAFFWREVAAMEAAGLPVTLFSTRAPDRTRSPHAFSDAARARTTYLFPPRWGHALAWLALRPRRTAAALAYVARLSETAPARRLRLMGLLPSASDLAAACATRGIDHLHVHSMGDAAHLASIAAILGGPGYSLTLHGDLAVYGTDHRAKLAGARFVTAVTAPLCAEAEAACPGITAEHLTMGVDTDRFAPAPVRPPAPGEPLRLVSVARLNPTKGHTDILAAMARLVAAGHNIHCDIAGDGPHRASIERDVARLGLGSRVRLLGALSETAVLDLLRRADVFLLASFGLGEAAPVAVMEAMACGLPVVCSRIGGTGDMIADGVDGLLVPQRDVTAIAAAIAHLDADPDLRRSLGAAARRAAVTRFDYRALAGRLADRIRAASARPQPVHGHRPTPASSIHG